MFIGESEVLLQASCGWDEQLWDTTWAIPRRVHVCW